MQLTESLHENNISMMHENDLMTASKPIPLPECFLDKADIDPNIKPLFSHLFHLLKPGFHSDQNPMAFAKNNASHDHFYDPHSRQSCDHVF